MAEELDEFGIPIRRKQNVSAEVDEFGIPIKKKTSSTSAPSGLKTNGGTSVNGTGDDPTYETGQLDEVNIIGKANPLNPNWISPEQNQFNLAQQSNPELAAKYEGKGVVAPTQETSRFDNLGKGLNSLYEGIAKIPRFVYGLAASPQNALADAMDMPSIATNYDAFLKTTQLPGLEAASPLTMLDQAADYFKGQAQNYEAKTKKYDQNIFESVKQGKFKDAGNQILDQITESAPSIAAMAMTSGAGSVAELGTITKTLANGLPFMSQKNAELQDDMSIPEWKKPLVSGFYGLAEVMLDQKYGTQAAIEGVINRFANEGAEIALEAGKDLVSSYIKSALKASGKVAKPFLEGAAEEASTQFAQNMLDKYALGQDRDLMEGVIDAAIVGGAMTGGINTAGSVASKILQPKQRAEVSELENQQIQLLDQLSNPGLTPEARKGVEQILDSNQSNIETIARETREAIAKLNPDQKKEVEGISERIQSAEAIVNDTNTTEEVKAVAQAQVESLGKEIDAIKPEPVVSKTESAESTPVKKGSDIKVGDEIVLVNGKRGIATEVTGEMVAIKMEAGGVLTANPSMVEMSILKPKEAVQETQTPVEVKEPVKVKQTVIEPVDESIIDITPKPIENETKQPVSEKKNVEETSVPKERDEEAIAKRTFAIQEINNGAINWDGDRFSPRPELDMSWRDIRKAQADLLAGKDTPMAKRLVDALDKVKQAGEYTFVQGSGSITQKTFVPVGDYSSTQLNETDLKNIADNEESLSKEYDEWFNQLSDEDKEQEINFTEDGEQNDNPTKSKEDVSDKKDERKAGDPLRSFASKIREGKINKLGGFRSSTGFDGAWDLGLEAVASGIEAGAKVADAIQQGLKTIKNTDWYKNLEDKDKFDTAYQKHMNDEYGIEEAKFSALRNADISEKRAELGLEEREKVKVLSNKSLVEQANQMVEEGYDTEALIDDILDGKREAKPEEVVILKEYQLAKEQQLIDLGEKIVDSQNSSRTVQDRLEVERDQILQDIDRAYQAGEKTGTVSARALQARKVMLINDYSLANMLIQKRKANGGDKLSSEQINQTTADYEKIKKLNEQFAKKVQELEAQNKELKSGNAFKGLKSVIDYEARKMGRTAQRSSIDTQINDTLDSLSKKLKAQRGTLSANAIPLDLIPDIAKLGKLYVQKGINTLEGVVDRIVNDLKADFPDVTPEEIEDIISNYDYEAEAKEEARLKAFKSRTEKRITDLRERTSRGDFAKRKFEPMVLDAEATNIQKELRKAKYDFDLALERDLLARRTKLEKARDFAADLFNVPRQLMATLDLSAPLRQGLVLTVNNPVIAGKSFVEMLKQAWSQERFDNWYDDLIETPGYVVMKESGLYIANQRRASLQVREEQFMSNLVEKIPVVGRLAKGSERAYVGYLNKLRADVFTQGALEFENEGKTLENNKPLYEALAVYVNAATGRGDLGKIENSAQILNSLFFSPRLIASRVRLLTNWANPIWIKETPKEVKWMYAKDMVRLIAFGSSILALAALGGADVEDDPRSSDFGKIRVGDKRWDIWGGFQQFVRFFTQLGTGQRKNTSDKMIREINGEGFKGETRADLMLNMVRSKLAPVPATVWNLAAGKNLVGEEYTWKDVPQSFLPLFATDLAKATYKDGAIGLLGSGVGAFGIGVQDYSKAADKPLTDAELKAEVKKAIAEMKDNLKKEKEK